MNERLRLLLMSTLLMSTLLWSGCAGSITDEGPPRFPLARNWRYLAEQRNPDNGRAEGSVQFTFQSGLRFDGSVDVVETDAIGQGERRTGLLSGRFRDSLTVDFDVRLDAETRRHVGHVKGDSITGEWLPLNGLLNGGGTFRMARQP